ncbi:hypothetical protein PsorP6_009907 [Peronosclerospora sorghi]|uniref:Uncharacterized protein n=1 Tax=Peronosclerospora sorghi TaxID=230839 RepID=A0ACC0W062_9STRA|nr:hypothetical protein PsorP6_009907 [Peronosclerospora sorghi]
MSYLLVKEVKVVIVALEGLENILRVGEMQMTNDINDIATMIDEADGVTKIQALQYHANEGGIKCLYERALYLLLHGLMVNMMQTFT